jgi:hypothetical protein
MDIAYQYFSNKTENWENKPVGIFAIEENLKALSWINSKDKNCYFAFNLNIFPVVRNSVAMCLSKSNACLSTKTALLQEWELMSIGKHCIKQNFRIPLLKILTLFVSNSD